MRWYLLGGVSAVLAGMAVIVAVTARSSFERERDRAAAPLRVAAASVADYLDPSTYGIEEAFAPLRSSPDVRSLDPARCRVAFGALADAVQGGYVAVFAPDGHEVCSVRPGALPADPLDASSWVGRVARGGTYRSALYADPLSREPVIMTALPLDLGGGRVGAIAAYLHPGTPAPPLPRALAPRTAVIAVDRVSGLVLAVSGRLPVRVGTPLGGLPFARSVPDGSSVRLPGDAVRVWVGAPVPNTTWWAYAGVPESAALGPARREVVRNTLVGFIAVALVGALGLVLNRRLVHPIRALERVMHGSADRTDAIEAPTDGPAEVAQLASVFNALMAQRSRREADLRRRATHDSLTGLLNRDGIAPAVHAALADDTAGDAAVLFVDLDRFKLINDTHGHAMGDDVLVTIASRLAAACTGGATLGRFGGDEFIAVMPPPVDVAAATSFARTLADVTRRPVRVGDVELYVGGSVGVAMSTDGVTPDDVVRNADVAMYHAKRRAADVAVFDDEMWRHLADRLALEADLYGALDRDELAVHYQPIVDLTTGSVVAAEALLRWAHPARGMVPPAAFIPAAEETGVIIPIGRWVLAASIRDAAEWQRAGTPILVAVNVSSVQLSDPELLWYVEMLLNETELAPASLVLEVTESTLADPVAGREFVNAARRLGVAVAIDDFGTGYSSLSYLHELPVDEVKIDRSFVARLGTDRSAELIIQAVVALGATLGMRVVAEGVETPEQRDLLVELGARAGQGWLFGRPNVPQVLTSRLAIGAAAIDAS